MASNLGKAALVLLVALVIAYLLVPPFRARVTRLTSPSETVTVMVDGGGENQAGGNSERDLRMVTVVGFDSIPAILEPEFVTVQEAENWMALDEQVLGLSVDGDHRAYSVPMLSSHEIVNDTVGGVPVAITW